MCKASIKFNKDQEVPHEYKSHLEDYHGVIFHHDIFLTINLLSLEYLSKITEEFHKSGGISSLVPRPNNFTEEVIDIEAEADRANKKKEKETPVIHKCEICHLEYYLLKDMIKCVNKHKMEETQNQSKLLKEGLRMSKSKSVKRTSSMMTEGTPLKKNKLQTNESAKKKTDDKSGTKRLDDMMTQIDNAIAEKFEPRKPNKIAARPPTPMKPPQVSDSPKTILSCDQCNFTAYKNIALKKHKKQEHNQEKVYPCNLCDKYFVSESNRDDHICDSIAKQTQDISTALDEPLNNSDKSLDQDNMGTALEEALNNSDKFQDQDISSNLEENIIPTKNQESNSSGDKLAKPPSFDEIIKMSKYFRTFPKQCRRGYQSDKLKYKLVDADVFPEGWFYRTIGSRGDREFFSPDFAIFRSKKAAGEYMKCMGIYGPEVLQKLGIGL